MSQIIIQSIATFVWWMMFRTGIRKLDVSDLHKRLLSAGLFVFFVAWLGGIAALGSHDFFRPGVSPPRIPVVLFGTLVAGWLLMYFSKTFRAILDQIPQHWFIGFQTFRILGVFFLIRYAHGEIPGVFAIPAGVGDIITGVAAPFVAYWYYKQKPGARTAAIAWNVFGIADLITAITIGSLVQGNGIVFPLVLIPVYAVPRALLNHTFSLRALLKTDARQNSAVTIG